MLARPNCPFVFDFLLAPRNWLHCPGLVIKPPPLPSTYKTPLPPPPAPSSLSFPIWTKSVRAEQGGAGRAQIASSPPNTSSSRRPPNLWKIKTKPGCEAFLLCAEAYISLTRKPGHYHLHATATRANLHLDSPCLTSPHLASPHRIHLPTMRSASIPAALLLCIVAFLSLATAAEPVRVSGNRQLFADASAFVSNGTSTLSHP